jgi:hypothetical protein
VRPCGRATRLRIAKRGDVGLNMHEDDHMSLTVQELLNSFDRLPEAEQREAASEILRRVRGLSFNPISDDELILSADELFLDLDRREDVHGRT